MARGIMQMLEHVVARGQKKVKGQGDYSAHKISIISR